MKRTLRNVAVTADFMFDEANEDRLCTRDQFAVCRRQTTCIVLAAICVYLFFFVLCPLTGYWLSLLFAGGDSVCRTEANTTSQALVHCHLTGVCWCSVTGFGIYGTIACVIVLIWLAIAGVARCRAAIKTPGEIEPLLTRHQGNA